jgi:hypothetical protein
MLRLLGLLFVLLVRSFCFRRDLLLENLALRQQLAVLEREASTTEVQSSGQAFSVLLCRLWPGWKKALMPVQPETVVSLASGRVQAGTREAMAGLPE